MWIRGVFDYVDNVMTKFIVNNGIDAWKTDINFFFRTTNCKIVRSCSLPQHINYKFCSVPVCLLMINISQWVCKNFCSYPKIFSLKRSKAGTFAVPSGVLSWQKISDECFVLESVHLKCWKKCKPCTKNRILGHVRDSFQLRAPFHMGAPTLPTPGWSLANIQKLETYMHLFGTLRELSNSL